MEPMAQEKIADRLFDLIDTDGDGVISFTEFFCFSLREALAREKLATDTLQTL